MVGIFAVSGKCRTQDGRGQNTAHVSELISGTWMSRNLSRGSETLDGLSDRINDCCQLVQAKQIAQTKQILSDYRASPDDDDEPGYKL